MPNKKNVDERIIEGFKELVLTVPVEKITIKEIADKAGIIRTTFYNHFQDKYEIIERILWEEVIQPAYPLIQMDMITESYLLIFKNIEKNRLFYQKLSRMEGQNSLSEIVTDCIRRMLAEYIRNRIGKDGEKKIRETYRFMTVDRIAVFFAQNMTFVAMSWLNDSTGVTPEEVAGVYQLINTNSLEGILSQLEKKN